MILLQWVESWFLRMEGAVRGSAVIRVRLERGVRNVGNMTLWILRGNSKFWGGRVMVVVGSKGGMLSGRSRRYGGMSSRRWIDTKTTQNSKTITCKDIQKSRQKPKEGT